MGDVYVARDAVLERDVAIKVLADRLAQDDEAHRRFTREALAAARLSGEPHVVTIYDVGEHEGRPFIVMELLSGGSLADRMRGGPVPPASALTWLEQAGRALDAAHRHRVVHRDVKPANLMLHRDDVVHVTDFGIASAAGFDELTMPGTIIGTAGYLSPEQARGEPAGPASDRYALAVVAFELLAGSRPFAAESPTAEALRHASEPPPSVTAINPRLPRPLDDVFARALAKQPDQRYETCADLVAALREAFHRDEPATVVVAPPAVPVPVPVRPAPARGRKALVPLLAGAAVLGLGGAALAFALTGGDGGPPTVVTRTVQGQERVLTVTEPVTVTAPPTEATQPPPPPADGRSGAQLNDEGFQLMQQENYEAALPLLEQAVEKLRGTGELSEAYASYNLAFTRFALGSCDGVLGLLDRSEAVQGERKEISQLRKRAERDCGGGGGGGGGGGED